MLDLLSSSKSESAGELKARVAMYSCERSGAVRRCPNWETAGQLTPAVQKVQIRLMVSGIQSVVSDSKAEEPAGAEKQEEKEKGKVRAIPSEPGPGPTSWNGPPLLMVHAATLPDRTTSQSPTSEHRSLGATFRPKL